MDHVTLKTEVMVAENSEFHWQEWTKFYLKNYILNQKIVILNSNIIHNISIFLL